MSSYNDDQTEVVAPLLEKGDVDSYGLMKRTPRAPRRGLWLHILLPTLYTVVFVISWLDLRARYIHGPNLTYDPVRAAIQYETQKFDHTQVFFNSTPKPYSGVPSPEKEAAWDDLLKNFNIRVTEDEMRQLGKLDDSLPLPDGGYFGSLTVFHQLHCIWRVQKALYPRYYWADLSDEEAFLNLGHSEHCLDVLRQSILCNADTSIMTMRWAKKYVIYGMRRRLCDSDCNASDPSPIADATNTHECVNWNAINSWAAQRAFDPFKPNYLVHPTLGDAFADERAQRIGVAISTKEKHFNEEKIKEILKYTSR